MPADSSGLVAGGARQLASKIDGCRKQNSAYQFARVPVLESNGCGGTARSRFFVVQMIGRFGRVIRRPLLDG